MADSCMHFPVLLLQHLNATVPEDFHEMICTCCMDKHSFLWAYQVDSPSKSFTCKLLSYCVILMGGLLIAVELCP